MRSLENKLAAKVTADEVAYATSLLLDKKLKSFEKGKKKFEAKTEEFERRITAFEEKVGKLLTQSFLSEENFLDHFNCQLENT